MSSLVRDARFGMRLLRRSPGFTAVATLTIALGVGAATAIFSVVYGVFLAPLPYRDADALVTVWSRYRGDRGPVAMRDYREWKARASVFSDLESWALVDITLSTGDLPEKSRAGIATSGFLAMLGYGHPLTLGRTFSEDEGTPGRDRVVVLTWRLWQERFGGDAAIIGRTIHLNGRVPYVVIGVLGRGPADRNTCELWMPLSTTGGQAGDDAQWLNVTGRLRPGVGVKAAGAAMHAVAAETRRAQKEDPAGWSAEVEAFRTSFMRDSTVQGLWLLLGAVGLLLLISCVNLANLLLARGSRRRHELALRMSLGATRGAVVGQLLVESLILSFGGGVLGVAIAWIIVAVVRAVMPPDVLPTEAEITLSVPVLVFAWAACTGAGLLAGYAPAWHATRTALRDVIESGGRSVVGRRHGLRRALVAVEFALALTLLAAAGATVQALARLILTDPGFRADRVQTFSVGVPDGTLPDIPAIERFHRALLTRIEALPGVESVAVSIELPLLKYFYGQRVAIVGRDVAPGAEAPGAFVNMVSPSYYRTYGIPILRGRAFTDRDVSSSAAVAIVNDTFVKQYLPGLDPLTARISMPLSPRGDGLRPPPREWQVVGVSGVVRNDGPGGQPLPQVDVPYWQDPLASAMVGVRLGPGPSPVVAEARGILRALSPDVTMDDVKTMELVVGETMAGDRFHAMFLGAFAVAALLLAAVGIYGVMSSVVAERTREIGLCLALGAAPRWIVGRVLRDGMASALTGTALGVAGAWAAGQSVRGLVPGVEAADPIVWSAVSGLLLSTALAACLVPARRAAAVDPLVALRHH